MHELTHLRTATSKTFDLGGGRRRVEIHVRPIHYRDEQGQWQDIDTTLRPDTTPNPYDLAIERAHLKARFKVDPTSAEPVRVEVEGGWITYRPTRMGWVDAAGTWLGEVAVAPVQGQANGNRITYAGAYPYVDESFIAMGHRLKHVLQLSALPTPASGTPEYLVFEGEVRLAEGLSLWAEGVEKSGAFSTPGPVEVRDASGKVVLLFPDAWAEEEGRPGERVDATYTFAPSGTGWLVETQIAWRWLSDPDRQFPVIVDPTTTLQPGPAEGEDTYVYFYHDYRSGEGAYDYKGNQPNDSIIRVGGTNLPGVGDWKRHRGLLRFDLSSIPPGIVHSASLYLKCVSTGIQPLTKLYESATEWTEAGAVWPGPALGDLIAEIAPSVGPYTFDVRQTVTKWVQRVISNFGFVIYGNEDVSANHLVDWASSDHNEPSYHPVFTIEYSSTLMFRNPVTGEYFSDVSGNFLRLLDFGPVMAGKETPVKEVVLENALDAPVNQVDVWIEGNVSPDEVQLSKTNNPFIPEPLPMRINGTFQPGADIATIYVRVQTDQSSAGTKQFTIKAKAKIAQ